MNQISPSSELVLSKERTLGELLNDSFLFFRIHAKAIIGPYLLVTLPLALIAIFPTYAYTHDIYGGNSSPDALSVFKHFTYQTVGNAVLMSLLNSLSYLSGMAMLLAYVEVSLSKVTGLPTFSESMAAFMKRFPKVLLSSIPIFLLILLGSILLIIPGIWFSIISLIFYPVLVLENRSFSDALSRSRHLVKGAWWQTFLVVLIASLLVGVIGSFISLFFGVFIAFDKLNGHQSANMSTMMFIMTSSISMLRVLLQIFTDIAVMLQYFNLKEQKDGSSLSDQISSLGNFSEPILPFNRKEEF